MSKSITKDSVNRIIDANINRLKEGLRVLEEIARFRLNDRALTAGLKNMRHRVDRIVSLLPDSLGSIIASRGSEEDVGKKIYGRELKRRDLKDIFFANIQRAKESARVLEEFTKLSSKNAAIRLKEIRYKLYKIEQLLAKKILR